MKLCKLLFVLFVLSSIVFLSACGKSDSQHVGSWTSASLLADSARFPVIGSIGNGNQLAVWAQPQGFYANLYTAGSGWGVPQKIGESSPGWSDLHLGVSRGGHAVVTWLHLEGGNDVVQAVRYTAGAGWSAAENLGNVGVPKDVAVADNGDVFLVAEFSTGLTRGLNIQRFSQGTGWSNVPIGYVDPSTGNGFPKVSVNGSGVGFVLWVEGDSGTTKVYVSRCTSAVQGAPELIASLAGIPGGTGIASDPNGNVMALWEQQDQSLAFHIYGSRYSISSGWGLAQRIDNSNLDCIDPALTVDVAGNFYAAWSQRTATVLNDIYSNSFNPSTGWQTPRQVGTGGTARYPRVAADTLGNIFAAWQQFDPSDPFPGDAKVYANLFTAGSGWGTPHQLRLAAGGADAPEIAAGPAGSATVVWSQSTGSVGGSVTYGVFSSRFE